MSPPQKNTMTSNFRFYAFLSKNVPKKHVFTDNAFFAWNKEFRQPCDHRNGIIYRISESYSVNVKGMVTVVFLIMPWKTNVIDADYFGIWAP